MGENCRWSSRNLPACKSLVKATFSALIRLVNTNFGNFLIIIRNAKVPPQRYQLTSVKAKRRLRRTRQSSCGYLVGLIGVSAYATGVLSNVNVFSCITCNLF